MDARFTWTYIWEQEMAIWIPCEACLVIGACVMLAIRGILHWYEEPSKKSQAPICPFCGFACHRIEIHPIDSHTRSLCIPKEAVWVRRGKNLPSHDIVFFHDIVSDNKPEPLPEL